MVGVPNKGATMDTDLTVNVIVDPWGDYSKSVRMAQQ